MKRVLISRATVGEFDLKTSVLLVTDEGDDWIDIIYDAVGDDSERECREWAEDNGYTVMDNLLPTE